MANLKPYANKMAKKYGVPVNYFFNLISAESSWDPDARNPSGAVGLGQLMPGTARGLGVDPFNWKQNLEGSARYFRMMFDRFGNWRDAARAYNQGPNAIGEPDAGAEYAAKVLGRTENPKGTPTRRAGAGAIRKDAPLPGPPRINLDPLKIAFADDPDFLDLIAEVHQEEPVALPGPELEQPRPKGKALRVGVEYSGRKLILPTSWTPTHVTDGLGWGTKTAADIMAAAGTPVGAPEDGVVLRWGDAQGGQSLWLRGVSGRVYWLGHLDNIAGPGTTVRRGQVIARVSADHPRPHVHIDAR